MRILNGTFLENVWLIYVPVESVFSSWHFSTTAIFLFLGFVYRCGPCKLIEPVLKRFAAKYDDEVIVAKFDVEGTNHNNLKLELLLEYGVRPTSLPSLFLLHNQQVHAKHEGLIMDDELDEIIKSNIRNDKKSTADADERKAGFVNLGGQQVDDYMLTDV